MENIHPVFILILLLAFVVLLPALIGLLIRFIAPKAKRDDLAGLLGIPLMLLIFTAQKEKLQSLLSICFEGAGLPAVDSHSFNILVAGAISIYILDLFLFYTIFRLMAKAGIEITDRIKPLKNENS